MNITKLFPSGGLEISTIHGGQLVRQRYFGYTRKEACALFRGYLATL